VLRIDPAAARARIEKAVTGRSVELYPAADGMAVLRANLPAPQGLRAHQLLTAAARAGRNAATDGDDRTMDARRADALIDCLEQLDPDPLPAPAATADADSAGHAYRPLSRRWHPGPVNLHVTVPLGTLLGLNDGPGELTGYGPIDADTARYLAEEATWRSSPTPPPAPSSMSAPPATTRRPTSTPTSAPATRRVGSRTAGSRPAAPTWTTPDPSHTDRPPRTTWPPCADHTTGSRPSPAGS